MARYRKIDPRIWNDAKFSHLSNDAKLLFIYLLTSPQAVRAWIVRGQIPLSRVMDVKKATGIPLKTLRPDYFGRQ